ncbi:MAG: hypothetical protein KBI26_10565, partial [Thermoanaerobaculia bacterium]|nr:hypothetical protein [Thermoanaerobaculia bacterium]
FDRSSNAFARTTMALGVILSGAAFGLAHSPGSASWVAGSSVLWVLILFAFTLSCYFARGWLGAGAS